MFHAQKGARDEAFASRFAGHRRDRPAVYPVTDFGETADDERSSFTSVRHFLSQYRGAMVKTGQSQPCDGNTSKEDNRQGAATQGDLTTTAADNLRRARPLSAGFTGNPSLATVLRATSLGQILDEWAAEVGQGGDEGRQEAVRRISAWVDAGDLDAALNLSCLRLRTLPAALPAGLRHLNADCNELTNLPAELPVELQTLNAKYNQLTSLPAPLPAGLQTLEVSYNRLASLPDVLPTTLRWLDAGENQLTRLPDNLPSELQTLNADGNQLTSVPLSLPALLHTLNADSNRLTSLPDNLPAGLQTLNASGNQLTNLPGDLPARLQTLGAAGNRLTGLPNNLPAGLRRLNARCNLLIRLPDKLLAQLGSGCMVFLESNPLPKQVRTNLAAAMNVADYRGPRVFL